MITPPFSETFNLPSESIATVDFEAIAATGELGISLTTCQGPPTLIDPAIVTFPWKIASFAKVFRPEIFSAPELCITALSAAAFVISLTS